MRKFIKKSRQQGLNYNDLCPHCNHKVKLTRYALPSLESDLAGYQVEHWFNPKICNFFFRLSDGKVIK